MRCSNVKSFFFIEVNLKVESYKIHLHIYKYKDKKIYKRSRIKSTLLNIVTLFYKRFSSYLLFLFVFKMYNCTRALLLITILIGVGLITSYVHADVSHLPVDGEFIFL